MEQMTIKWTNNGHQGQMCLNMRTCFPCSASWLRKLLRTTVDRCDNPEAIRAELVIYLNELYDEAASASRRVELLGKITACSIASGLAKAEIDRLTSMEKAQSSYVKSFVKRSDKENVYRKQLESTRDQIKEQKKAYRSEIAKASAARRAIDKMDRDEKNIRECLALLGQEG